ncbi:hypothetical protein [Phaeobacter inhibens]|uniref:hypothetical protein n=1 Tax=Phaeobacter inhibens TaxID=221822 RepID=UPI0020C79F90|nr:hypothetical protein [Phaeobacter inhibens]
MKDDLLFFLRGQQLFQLIEAVVHDDSAVLDHLGRHAIADGLYDLLLLAFQLALFLDEVIA